MRSSTRTQGPNYLSPAFYLGRAITAVVDYVAKKNKGPDARILDSIVVDFKRGILCGTAGMPAEILTEHEAATAWERRDFFREGYALGLAALHALTFSRGNPERRNRHPHNFRIMHYTGYGVWNAFAGMVGLPRISNDPNCWLDVPDFARYRLFMAGGDAYGKVVMKRCITAKFFQNFERTTDRTATQAAWHGCGRALWFCWTGDTHALVSLLRLYPPATSALAMGLGTAITFTQIGAPDRVQASIHGFPTFFHDLLAQGSGMALGGMIVENPAVSDRVYALYSGDLRRRLDETLQAAEEARIATLSSPERWYGTFFTQLERIRSRNAAMNPSVSLVTE
jgi:hypothetical protein